MKVSREMKKQEALAWMTSLLINQAVIDEFREHDTVFLCSGTDGSFSKLEDRDHPNCSDMGSIIVKRSQNGGLIRLG